MKFYSNIDLLLNEIQNFRVHNLAAAPQNPVEGQHYFNTVDKTEYVFDGTKWVNALSHGNYTFKNGIVEDENRNVSLTAATADAIGGVTIGKNIDVEAGKISVKDASETDKGLIQVASDAEATAGTDTLKAINAKQLKAVADAADEAVKAEKERAQAAEKANADAIAADVADLAAFKTTVADTYVPLSQKGAANGVATLDANGLVPAAQLPSFVDDVIDLVAIAAEAPAAATVGQKYYNETDKKIYTATAENTWGDAKDPEADKIYVNIGNNMSYRWSGTTMVQIGTDKLKGFNGTITGDATTTTFTLNHNLGTRNVVCEVYDATTYEKVYVNILHASTTAIQAVFSQAPAVGENFIVTIIAIG